LNCRSLHGKPGQVGFARDDKKERVVKGRGLLPKEKAFVGPAGTPFPSTTHDDKGKSGGDERAIAKGKSKARGQGVIALSQQPPCPLATTLSS